MGKKNIIKIMLIFSILLVVPTLSPAVSADGCVFIPTVEEWIHIYEEKQIGLIKYENGIENLTLVIDIKNSSLSEDEAFWIFPIPGDPNNIDIGITEDIDFYYGGYRDIRDEAKQDISDSFMLLSFSQAYLSMVPFFSLYMFSYAMGHAKEDYNDITIHETAEKMGFTSQLISANDKNNTNAINNYLESKNITLDSDAMELIEEYVGEDFCFVVSWISDIDEFKEQAMDNPEDYYYWYYGYGEPFHILGISVEFPTNDIYYPMKLTSIYGEKKIPILLQVNGHVTPKNTYSGMSTHYYTDDSSYTEIKINTESNDFSEDLYIENKEPLDVQNAKFIKNNALWFIILVFILCSILASIGSAFIVYRKNNPDYKKFILLGFCNFLSIFFVFVMCFVLKINEKFVEKPIKNKEVSKLFDIGFKIAFLVLGLISLVMFLLIFVPYFGFLMFFILSVFSLVIGILMFIYGSIKNPKATFFTALFSIFFFVFLIAMNIIVQITL